MGGSTRSAQIELCGPSFTPLRNYTGLRVMVSKLIRLFCPMVSAVWAVIGVPVGCADKVAMRDSSTPSTVAQHARPTGCLMIALLAISFIFHEEASQQRHAVAPAAAEGPFHGAVKRHDHPAW
jgi:hypothetical protein